MRTWISAVIVLVACGGDSEPDLLDAATAIDATAVDASTVDSGSVDALAVDAPVIDVVPIDAARSDAPIAPPLPPGPNRVFVTAHTEMGDFGGLEVADTICNREAAAAGLDGTFVAWLSTSTVYARDRLGASRGWVRVDGAPVIDTVGEWLARGEMFNPIDRDATGAVRRTPVWTGTGPDGKLSSAGTCFDWTKSDPPAELGLSTASMPAFTRGLASDCSSKGAFVCFEVGLASKVVPAPDPGATRHAFVSRAVRTAPGIDHLDDICRTEAAAAGLVGSYRAAVATTTAAIARRFTRDERAWRRIDGTLVARSDFLDAPVDLASFVNQHADGTYTARATMTGASRPDTPGANTCDDWQAVGAGVYDRGDPGDTDATRFWRASHGASCATAQSILCLQE